MVISHNGNYRKERILRRKQTARSFSLLHDIALFQPTCVFQPCIIAIRTSAALTFLIHSFICIHPSIHPFIDKMIEPPKFYTDARRHYDLMDIEVLGKFIVELGIHCRPDVRFTFEQLMNAAGTQDFPNQYRVLYDYIMVKRQEIQSILDQSTNPSSPTLRYVDFQLPLITTSSVGGSLCVSPRWIEATTGPNSFPHPVRTAAQPYQNQKQQQYKAIESVSSSSSSQRTPKRNEQQQPRRAQMTTSPVNRRLNFASGPYPAQSWQSQTRKPTAKLSASTNIHTEHNTLPQTRRFSSPVMNLAASFGSLHQWHLRNFRRGSFTTEQATVTTTSEDDKNESEGKRFLSGVAQNDCESAENLAAQGVVKQSDSPLPGTHVRNYSIPTRQVPFQTSTVDETLDFFDEWIEL